MFKSLELQCPKEVHSRQQQQLRLVEWKPFRNECNKVSLFVKGFFSFFFFSPKVDLD